MALGLFISVVVPRFLESMLFGVAPLDLLTYSFAALTLLGAGFLASAIPALRALAVEPVLALQHD